MEDMFVTWFLFWTLAVVILCIFRVKLRTALLLYVSVVLTCIAFDLWAIRKRIVPVTTPIELPAPPDRSLARTTLPDASVPFYTTADLGPRSFLYSNPSSCALVLR